MPCLIRYLSKETFQCFFDCICVCTVIKPNPASKRGWRHSPYIQFTIDNLMMTVLNLIVSFRFPIITKKNGLDEVRPFSTFLVIFKLCLFCCTFVAISIPVLPFTMIVQTAANFSFYPNICFLHVFAILHSS